MNKKKINLPGEEVVFFVSSYCCVFCSRHISVIIRIIKIHFNCIDRTINYKTTTKTVFFYHTHIEKKN